MSKTPEGRLKADIALFLKASGKLHFRMNSGITKVRGGYMHHAKEGTADYLIFDGTDILWAEIKAPGQKTAKDREQKQAEFRNRVLAEGHNHAVITSVQQMALYLKGEPLDATLARGKERLLNAIAKEKRWN